MKKHSALGQLWTWGVIGGVLLVAVFALGTQKAVAQSDCIIDYGHMAVYEVYGDGRLDCTFEASAGDNIIGQCMGCSDITLRSPDGRSVSLDQPLAASGTYTLSGSYSFMGEKRCVGTPFSTESICYNSTGSDCEDLGASIFSGTWCPENQIYQDASYGTVALMVDLVAGPIDGMLMYSGQSGESTLFSKERYEIFQVSSDGVSRPLISGDSKIIQFAISPDGTKIAYVEMRSSHEWGNIVISDINGANPQSVTRRGEDAGLSWSPDSQRLVFMSSRDTNNNEIYVINADGSDLVRLTKHRSRDRWPKWSPDGETIYFNSDRSGTSQIYAYNVTTKDLQQLTDDEDVTNMMPIPSPDGSLIMFMSDMGNVYLHLYDGKARDIHIMNADGSDRRRIGRNIIDAVPMAWSPDGSQVLFFNDLNRLMLMDVNGENIRRIRTPRGVIPTGFGSWVKP